VCERSKRLCGYGRTIGHIVGHGMATASAGFPARVSVKFERSCVVNEVKHLSAHVHCLIGQADAGGVWSGPVFQRSGFQSSDRDSLPRVPENLEAKIVLSHTVRKGHITDEPRF